MPALKDRKTSVKNAVQFGFVPKRKFVSAKELVERALTVRAVGMVSKVFPWFPLFPGHRKRGLVTLQFFTFVNRYDLGVIR